MEGDSKTLIVPKTAIKVATSVIQTGSSRGGHCKESNIGGEQLEQYSHAGNLQRKNCQYLRQLRTTNAIKEELPEDRQEFVLICLRTNPVTRLRADLPTEPTLR